MTGSLIWLASYPKSGNTWLRLLLANLLSDSQDATDINQINLPQRCVTNRHTFEEITLIDSSLLRQEEVDAMRPAIVNAISAETDGDTYVKLHDAYRILPDGKPLLGIGHARAALYVVRDPRDVVISFAFHNGTSIDRAITLMNDSNGTISRNPKRYTPQVPQLMHDWSGHVEGWIDQRDVPVHVIRYEDLHASPIDTLQKAANFLGLTIAQERIAHAVRCTQFSSLQRKEQDSGFRERIKVSTAPFFRSGRTGSWREELSVVQQRRITEVHHRVMTRFNYL